MHYRFPTAVAVFFAASGCIDAGSKVCGSFVCPGESVCLADVPGCHPPDLVEACSGRDDGALCSSDGFQGVCDRGVCQAQRCGDGVAGIAEQCEGVDLKGQTCLDFGFYAEDGLACSEACEVDTTACTEFCGDAIQNGPVGVESCDTAPPAGDTCFDSGSDMGSLACSDRCVVDESGCRRLSWKTEATPTTNSLHGVWVKAADEVLAVGSEVALRYDGISWAFQDLPDVTLTAIWGSSDGTRLVAVGELAGAGVVYTLDEDGAWVVEPHPSVAPLRAVGGTGASDIWAVGDAGAVLHFDGSTWNTRDVSAATFFTAVAGLDSGDLWLFGSSTTDTVFERTGSTFASTTLPLEPHSAFAFAADDIFIGGTDLSARFDGSQWQTIDFSGDDTMQGLWGQRSDRVMAVAGRPRFSGGGARAGWTDFVFDGFPLRAIHGLGETVYAVGESGHVVKYEGAAFSVATTSVEINRLGPVWSPSASDAYAGVVRPTGAIALGHRRDGVWTVQSNSVNSISEVSGYRDASSTVVFFGGQEFISVFHEESGLTRSTSPIDTCPAMMICQRPTARGLHAYGPNRAFAGSTPDVVYQLTFDPGNATLSAIPRQVSEEVVDLWAVNDELQFIAAKQGVILVGNVIDGFAPMEPPLPTTATVTAIVAFAADNIVAGTQSGSIYQFDGSDWTERLSRVNNSVREIMATGPDDIFALYSTSVGVSRLFHFDGQTWAPVRIPSLSTELSVSPTSIALSQSLPAVLDQVIRVYRP